jgi:hypothetical protein
LFEGDYVIKNRLPFDWIGRRPIREKVLFRAWVGSSQALSPKPWEEMERIGESRPVFVFPKAGEKYHSETCGFVSNMPTETLLTTAIRRKYDPCHLCGASDAADYELVYCYFRAGEVYHIGRCSLVDKFIVKMERTDAEERGYAPCMKCR